MQEVKACDLFFLSLCISIFALLVYYRRYRQTCARAPRDEKPTPDSAVFAYPKIEPCLQDLAQIKPIPYRPFRWGNYHVTMGIRPMEWDSWIELDQQYVRYHQIRDYRIKSRRNKVIKTLDAQPGIVSSGHAAATELVYELAEYLSRRYPATFIVTRHSATKNMERGWDGLGRIHTITVIPVDRTFDLDVDDPMTISALLIQDDLAIMIEGSDGRYYLQAGAIVIPGTWRLEDKAGMPLDEIHLSGDVPLYRQKLHLSLGRFFKRMPVEKPVIRNNYTFQVVDPVSPNADIEKQTDPGELSWATSMLGDEDHKPSSVTAHDVGTSPPTPGMIKLRTERQTLRRLPKTGAIVFTIRTYITPIEMLVKEPGLPGRLASSVRSWPEAVARYKHHDLFEEVLLEYLDEWHKKQIEQKIDSNDSNYPW